MLNVQRLLAGPYEENAYLVWADGRPGALLVDPGGEPAMLLAEIQKRGLTLTHILLTHGHFDHILAVPELIRSTDAAVWIHPLDEGMLFDPYPLKLPGPYKTVFEPLKLTGQRKVQGDAIDFQGARIEMIHTPGHTPGGACFYLPDDRIMFTGDTLFKDGYGRTDFANASAADMSASLLRLFEMPGDIRIMPGHEGSGTIGGAKRRLGL